MWITVFFTHGGEPKTGLSPSVSVWDVSDDSLVVNAQTMSEIAGGWYKYDFSGYVELEEYVVTCDGGSTLGIFERYADGANVVYAEEISGTVWDEDLTSHTTKHSAGWFVMKIRKIVYAILAFVS